MYNAADNKQLDDNTTKDYWKEIDTFCFIWLFENGHVFWGNGKYFYGHSTEICIRKNKVLPLLLIRVFKTFLLMAINILCVAYC